MCGPGRAQPRRFGPGIVTTTPFAGSITTRIVRACDERRRR
jgi:hypothetical protein